MSFKLLLTFTGVVLLVKGQTNPYFDFDISDFPAISHASIFPDDVTNTTSIVLKFQDIINFDLFESDDLDPQFICEEFFEMRNEEDAVVTNLNCRMCLDEDNDGGGSTDTMFLTLAERPFLKDIPTTLKVKRRNETETAIFNPNLVFPFEVIKVVEARSDTFAIVFTSDVHFVRNGFGGTTRSFRTFCEEVFSAGLSDLICTFEFENNIVHVQLDDNTDVPFEINFIPDKPSFFSIDDKFGLRPTSNQSFTIREQPKLIDNQHLLTEESFGSVLFAFDQPLLEQDTDRVLCSDILEFTSFDLDFEVELFSERSDLFCSLKFVSNQVTVGFPEIMAMFPFDDIEEVFHFQFKDFTLFVSEDGLSTAINDEDESPVPFFSKEEVYENISFKVIGPTNELSKCDTEFRLEVVQISGVNLRFNLIASADDFCDIFDTTITCTTDSFTETDVIIHEFIFRVEAVFVGDIFSEFIGETEPFLVTQDFGEQRIPVQIVGLNLDEGVTVERGESLSLTAVLANDVFECADSLPSQKINFNWCIIEDVDNELISSSKLFRLPENSLAIGEYLIELTASADSSLELSPNTLSLSLSVVATDIFLVSTSGSEVIVATNTPAAKVELNALRSCNANVVDGCVPGLGLANEDIEELALLAPDEQIAKLGLTGFNLEWKCISCDEVEEVAIFDNVNRSVPLLDIPLANFEIVTLFQSIGRSLQEGDDISSQFEFVFEVTDENDEGVVTPLPINVNLVTPPDECILPEIELLPVDPIVNSDSGLSIVAIVSNSDSISDNITFSWTAEEAGLPFQPDIVLNRETLFVPENTLTDGTSYEFRLDVSVECAEVAGIEIFASTVFETNIRPFGGLVDIQPKNASALDTFTITTGGWIDPNGNLPLEFAFDIIYLTEEELANFEDIPTQKFSPLSQFSQSVSLTTNLQVAPENKTGVIVALARDSLGAISRRAVANTASDFVVLNPFEEDIDLDEIIELIDDLKNTGDTAQIPNLCSAIGSSLNSLPEDTVAELGDDVLEAREICLESIFEVIPLDGNLDDLALDPDVVNLVATSLSSLTEKPDQINLDTLSDVADLTNVLVDAMEQEVINALRVENDPAAAAIIPDSFRENIAGTVSNILGVTNFQLTGNNSETIEVSSETKGQIISVTESSRASIENVGILQTTVLVPGAPQVTAEASNIKLAAVREDINVIGEATGQIVVPDGVEGANSIDLPNTFSNDLKEKNLNSNDALSIVAIKYGLPIIFDRDLVKIERADCSYAKYTYDGPLEGAEGNILALDFFSIGNETSNAVVLVVEDLVEPIVLFLDIPVEVIDLEEVTSIEGECQEVITELNEVSPTREAVGSISFEDTCGFFIDGDFTPDFCETGSIVDNKLECRCIHATDYVAWKLFKYDVSRTLKDQIKLTDLVAKIFGSCAAVGFVLIALSTFWAYYKDQEDGHKHLRTALARAKLMRVLRARQKRRLFENINTAKLELKGDMHDNVFDPVENAVGNPITRKESEGLNYKSMSYLKRTYMALKYEHSVIGLVRYDPNLSRLERISLLIAVIISSFGTVAVFFELSVGADQTAAYQPLALTIIVFVSVVSALVSTILFKKIVKFMFKTTELKKGSIDDQVNMIYRILYRIEQVDGSDTALDERLLDAISDVVQARNTLTKLLKESKKTSETSSEEDQAEELALTFTDDIVTAGEVGATETHDEAINRVLEEQNNAEVNLKHLTSQVRQAWKRNDFTKPRSFYISYKKSARVKRQPSFLLKAAAVLSGSASKMAKGVEKTFSYKFNLVDWLLLIVWSVFCLYYIVRFVGTREQRATEFNELLEMETETYEPKTEAQFIEEWVLAGVSSILISYLLFEPIFIIVRYTILPWVVSKNSGKDFLNAKELQRKHDEAVKNKGKDKDDKRDFGDMVLDALIDLLEGLT